jgi:hypothetical protein
MQAESESATPKGSRSLWNYFVTICNFGLDQESINCWENELCTQGRSPPALGRMGTQE